MIACPRCDRPAVFDHACEPGAVERKRRKDAAPVAWVCARCSAPPAVEWRDDAGRLLCGTCALACVDREGTVTL